MDNAIRLVGAVALFIEIHNHKLGEKIMSVFKADEGRQAILSYYDMLRGRLTITLKLRNGRP